MADDNTPPGDPETFSKDYVRELRAENKGWRLKLQDVEQKLAAAVDGRAQAEATAEAKAAARQADEIAKRLSEAEAKHAEALKTEQAKAADAMSKAQLRAVNADLRIAAKEAGAADIADVLALLPRDKLKLNDDGDVTNAAEVVAEFKKAKPHLFGSPSTTTNPKSPPRRDDNQPNLRHADPAEVKRALAAYGVRG